MAQCSVCGETKFDNWTYCPACGHGYDWDPVSDDQGSEGEDERTSNDSLEFEKNLGDDHTAPDGR